MKEEITRNVDATDEENAREVGPLMTAGHANCRQILRVREGEEGDYGMKKRSKKAE